MSWHYLPELAEGSGRRSYSATELCVRSRFRRTDARCCFGDRGTVCFPCSRSGTTSGGSTADPGVERWISSLPDSPASRSAWRADGEERPTSGTSGRRPSGSSGKYGQLSSFLRMSPACSPPATSGRCSVTWPKAGTMLNGWCWARTTWEPPTAGTGCGSSRGTLRRNCWATPTTRDWKDGTDPSLAVPTNALLGRQAPRVLSFGALSHLKDRFSFRRLTLNPTFSTWLMGWPIGAIALKRLETDRFRSWLRLHSSLLADALGCGGRR